MTLDRRSPSATDALVREELARRLSRIGAASPAAVSDEAVLAEIGIGSLDLLELVDALETATGSNPFEGRLALSDVRSVGDLCAAYRPAPENFAPDAAGDALLELSRKRAEARRRGRQP